MFKVFQPSDAAIEALRNRSTGTLPRSSATSGMTQHGSGGAGGGSASSGANFFRLNTGPSMGGSSLNDSALAGMGIPYNSTSTPAERSAQFAPTASGGSFHPSTSGARSSSIGAIGQSIVAPGGAGTPAGGGSVRGGMVHSPGGKPRLIANPNDSEHPMSNFSSALNTPSGSGVDAICFGESDVLSRKGTPQCLPSDDQQNGKMAV